MDTRVVSTLLAIVNNAAMNVGIRIPLQNLAFNSFGDVHRNGIT